MNERSNKPSPVGEGGPPNALRMAVDEVLCSIRTARTAMGKTSNSSVGEIHESPANERPALALRLRMHEQYAPISVCYMPTNGRRFLHHPNGYRCPRPTPTIRPWRIISRFPQGKHITFSKKIYHVCHAHISLCRRHLPPLFVQ